MASQPPIFRAVEVGTGQYITLGESIPADVRPMLEPAGKHRQLRMRTGTFGHASSITVELPDEEIVQAMDFAYDAGTDYNVLLGNFEAELGAPTDRVPNAEQSAVWQDSQTRFELFSRGGSVGSVLSDLAAKNS